MKNHKIIFKDRTVEWVQKELYDKIWEDSNSNSSIFKANGNVYRFENIYKMEEPKKQYPTFDPNKFLGKRKPERRLKAIRNMAKGLKKYIDSDKNRGTGKPEKLLELFRLSYSRAKKEVKQS